MGAGWAMEAAVCHAALSRVRAGTGTWLSVRMGEGAALGAAALAAERFNKAAPDTQCIWRRCAGAE